VPEVAVRTEATLISSAQRGDRGAFEQIYRLHVGRVYAICLRLEADERRAEELTQDVFVRVWNKMGSFRGKSQFSSWLYRLAVNVVMEDRRTRVRRSRNETPSEDAVTYASGHVGRHTDASLDLELALRTLPSGARDVFVLYDVEGYKHEEIAAMMGITTGGSKAQLHRARKLLREVLK